MRFHNPPLPAVIGKSAVLLLNHPPCAKSYSDLVHRRGWIVFAALQVIGILFGISAESFNRWGAQFWSVSFAGLFPGNVLAALLIERSFWNSGMSLRAMSLLEIPVMVAMNGVAWFSVAVAFRKLRAMNLRRVRPKRVE